MREENIKEFNLEQYRPKVLLLGNGLVRSKENASSWDKIIQTFNNSKGINNDELKNVPYSLQAAISTPKEDEEKYDQYINIFKDYKYTNNEDLRDLVQLPFDAILTTNYTYDIENCLLPKYVSICNKVKYAKYTSDRYESKYLLRTFNRVQDRDIWHIHGELRRKSSIILTHDEYARLAYREVEYLAGRRNDYQKYSESVRFKSWLDYFILGDIYIVGLSCDFSEFDLWWLLTRRLRERAKTGKIVFYNPLCPDGKMSAIQMAMKNMDAEKIKVETFNMKQLEDTASSKDENAFFNSFYKEVIKDISSHITQK